MSPDHRLALMLRSMGHAAVGPDYWVHYVGDALEFELGPRAARWRDELDAIVQAAVAATGASFVELVWQDAEEVMEPWLPKPGPPP